MTLEQVKQLSDNEIRIKVAELLGWADLVEARNSPDAEKFRLMLVGPFALTGTTPNGTACWRVPNYPQDLNACAEMEETLDDSQKDNFEYVLGIVIGPGREHWRWHLLHATARQRCEAFIAVKEREREI